MQMLYTRKLLFTWDFFLVKFFFLGSSGSTYISILKLYTRKLLSIWEVCIYMGDFYLQAAAAAHAAAAGIDMQLLTVWVPGRIVFSIQNVFSI